MDMAPAEPPSPAAVAALVAITSVEADPALGDASVSQLAETIREATDASAAVVWTHDPREAAGRLIAASGLDDGAASRVAQAIEADGVDEEVEITPGGAGALARALDELGSPWGLVGSKGDRPGYRGPGGRSGISCPGVGGFHG